MDGAGGRRFLMSFARLGATVALSSAITATVLAVMTPEPALTDSEPTVVVTTPQLYPVTVGTAPSVTYASHDALIQDYVETKRQLADLRHAIDYDLAHGGELGASVHEWADQRPPGTFGGGRKP